MPKASHAKKVQDLRKALYERAKREPSLRFYSVYDKVYRQDVLAYAFALCRANKGAPGPDGVTFDDIERSGGPGPMLARLAEIARWARHKRVRRLPEWSLARGTRLYREHGLATWWRRRQPS